MSNFLGIKQVLFSQYSGLTQAEKIGYLWLVRNGEGSESFDIYFGSRKYGSNDLSVISKLQDAFGGLLDEQGGFKLPMTVNFESFNDESVNDFSDILLGLDGAIKANQTALANVYTKGEVEGLISGVEALLADYAKNVTVTVGDATYTGTVEGNVVNVDLSDAFEAAGKVKDVTVDGVSAMNGTTAVIDLTGKADKSTVETISGKVDALELIKHATDVKYDTNTKHINLYAGEEKLGDGFDASPFLVDGMLNTVEFVKDDDGNNTTTLRFSFNTDGGEKVIDVNFAEYVDTYHADGTSIELDSSTNTFSVKNVDASKTTLSTTIEVNGGPLADDASDNWPWTEDGKKVIPSGKTIEEIFTSLFLKIIEGTVAFGSVSWSPGVAAPTVTLSKTGTVEVGTKVKVSTLSNGAFNKAKRSVTLTTTQGYFSGDTYDSSKSKTFYSAESTSSGTETISCKWNNVATDITVNSTELETVEGTNTISATQSGLVATVSAIPEMTVNASTNTKTKLTDTTPSKKQVATFKEANETYTSGTLSNSASTSVTAYYPIYTNGKQGSNGNKSTETTLVANDGTKLALVADNTYFYVNFAPMIDGGTGYRLLVRSGKKITEAMALNTLNNNYEVNMKDSFVKESTTVEKASGDSSFDYDVYEAKGSAGANAIRFKID